MFKFTKCARINRSKQKNPDISPMNQKTKKMNLNVIIIIK